MSDNIAMAARRRQQMARRRIHRARSKPHEVKAPEDTDDFPTIPFPESNSREVFRADVYENQGTREYMEDMHHVVIERDHSFFGIYDGHGGRSVPKYVKKYLYTQVREFISDERFETPEEAIKESFTTLEDKLFIKSRKKYEVTEEKPGEEEKKEEEGEEEEPISGGSCASVLYVMEDLSCIAANVGDCKMVLFKKTGEYEVLTVDHDTNNDEEISRIQDGLVGVRCPKGGRVGGLKVTRAFGDFFRPKGQKVICAEPHISTFKLDPKIHHSIVIASDGLWENISEKEVFDELRPEVDPRISTRKLMTKVVEKVRDNITICVIHVHEEVSEETKKRAEMLKKFMASRYANDDIIKNALQYRKEREANPDSMSVYQRMLLEKNKKKEDKEGEVEESSSESESSGESDSDDSGSEESD